MNFDTPSFEQASASSFRCSFVEIIHGSDCVPDPCNVNTGSAPLAVNSNRAVTIRVKSLFIESVRYVFIGMSILSLRRFKINDCFSLMQVKASYNAITRCGGGALMPEFCIGAKKL